MAGGATASVVSLAVVLTLGLLAFAPLGAAAPQVGIPAAFVSVTLGALLYAWLGRSAMPVGGPSSATALILASLLAEVARDPLVALGTPQGAASLMAAAALVVVLMGLCQAALALLGLGKLAKFVPQPVLAGFMNGVAVLIVLSQLPTLLGVSGGWSGGTAGWQAGTLAVGLAVAMGTWLVGWRWPRAPASLLGLAGGLLLYALLHRLMPALPLGELVGPLPANLPPLALPQQLLDPAISAFLQRHAVSLLGAALLLALISSLETVLGSLGLDQLLNTRHDAGRELLVLGLVNVLVGLCGGLPMVFQRGRALAMLQAGGRGQRAAAAGALAFLLMLLLGGPWLALLPKTVLAGMMLTVAVALMDRWTRQLLIQWGRGERSADLHGSLAVVALVCAVTIWLGFVAGVAVGMAAALLIFIRSMNRSLLRARYSGIEQPSRRLYLPAQEALLRTARSRIVLLELEGALFFGSADRLSAEAEALPPGCRYLVLDFKRISTIDESGAVLLQQLSLRLRERGIVLLLAGVDAAHGHGRRLRAFGGFREAHQRDWFADADRAIEAAEQRLLAEAGPGLQGAAVALEDCGLMQDLTPVQRALLSERMPSERLPAGSLLFSEGDEAECLYVLAEGSITVFNRQGLRYLSFSAGLMLGETAMLDGRGRSASAVADSEVLLYRLSRVALAELAVEHPALGAQIYRNIAVHLSARLRAAVSR